MTSETRASIRFYAAMSQHGTLHCDDRGRLVVSETRDWADHWAEKYGGEVVVLVAAEDAATPEGPPIDWSAPEWPRLPLTAEEVAAAEKAMGDLPELPESLRDPMTVLERLGQPKRGGQA